MLIAAGAGVAEAQEEGTIRTTGPVDRTKCDPCHARIADAKNPRIIFKHAFHMLISCEACHTQFPHQPDKTIKPQMAQCMACHGLRHGPSGLMASDVCADCHRVPPRRPSTHRSAGWTGKGHVRPARQATQTDCMLCHRRSFCEGCHRRRGVRAKPAADYVYDSGRACLACHAVPTLSALSHGKPKSFFVKEALLTESVHSSVSCNECHSDFRHFQDVASTRSYIFNASVSCMADACHGSKAATDQVKAYLGSVHGQRYQKGTQRTATCGGCHGGHDIYKLSTDLGKKALRTESEKVCGSDPGCHKKKYEEYNDYYHGAAYKKGAPDAPSCWQCHGAHEVLPSEDASSWVSANMLPVTCGSCHQGAQEKFADYAKLIHKTTTIKQATFVGRMLDSLRSWLR